MRLFVLSIAVLLTSEVAGQDLFAISDGDWSDGEIWSFTQGGASCSCTPSSTNTVFLDGFETFLDGDFTILDLAVRSTNRTPGLFQLNTLALFSPFRLTINGRLLGVSSTHTVGAAPTEPVLEDNSDLVIRLTGANNSTVINFWSYVAPVNTLEIVAGGQVSSSTNGQLSISGQLLISSGTFRPRTNIAHADGFGEIVVANGATLNLSFASVTGNGSDGTNFSNIIVSGTANISGTQHLSVDNLTLNSGGTINVTSSGVNQTQGWWYQSSAPTGTVTLNGTVSYGAGANQTVATNFPYTTLNLAGSGTKTTNSAAALRVTGPLTINSGVTFNSDPATAVNLGGNVTNNGTWSPADLVTFNGTGTQTLTSTPNVVSFNGGIDVGTGSTTTTLSLQDNIDVNGQLRVRTNATLAVEDNTVSLSGNLVNDGTITDNGTSAPTFQFDGNTTISGSAAPSFPNVVITGSLTAPSQMNVRGNFTNNNTPASFNPNSGRVTFNGTADQVIGGSSAITFNDISVSNSGTNGVGVGGTVNLVGTLNLSGSGKFDADGFADNGTLVVRSTSINGGGRIGALTTPANFNGNVTIERYVNAPDDWRYFSMPLINGNLGMWHDDFPITGNFSNATTPAQDPNVISATAPSVYRYNAATQAWVALGSGAATGATNLSNTTGYSAYSYNTTDFTIDVRGLIGKGDINIPLSTGFNLVPNPYPSAIDWDAIGTTGLSTTVHVRRGNNSFATYVQGAPSSTNHPDGNWRGELALGQSFWIESTGATTLALTENVKIGTYQFVREGGEDDYFKMRLRNAAGQYDETMVWFAPNSTRGVDAEYDGRKRLNEAGFMNFSTYTDNQNDHFAINAIAPISCSETIKLRFANVSAGNYSLVFDDLSHLSNGYLLELKDNFLSQTVSVDAEFSYDFAVTSDPASVNASRFEVIISAPQIATQALEAAYVPRCASPSVQLTLANSQPGVNYRFTKQGAGIGSAVRGNGETISFFIPKTQLEGLEHTLGLQAETAGGCSSTAIAEMISFALVEDPQVPVVTGATVCSGATATLLANGARVNESYRWYAAADAQAPISNQNAGNLTVSDVSQSTTYFVSVVNTASCESTRVPVTLTVAEFPAAPVVSAAALCGPGTGSITLAEAPEGGSYRVYADEGGSNLIASTTEGGLEVEGVDQTASFFVSTVNSLGCESTTKTAVTVEVKNPAAPELALTGNTFTTNATADVTWYRNGDPIAGATGSSWEATQSGIYYVTAVVDGCLVASSSRELVITGIENGAVMSLYPNPVDDQVSVRGATDKHSVVVYNAIGKQVDLEASQAEDGIVIDTIPLDPGTYIVRVSNGKGLLFLKFIKR